MKTKRILPILMIAAGMFMFLSMTSPYQATDWDVPANYKNMKNPYASQGDPEEIGKDLYDMHCKSCHGEEGYGDGKKADNLETPMRDFTSDEVQAQTDGELYYKSFVGREEMPNFEKKIPAKQDRWLIVNYIRILAE